MIGGISLFHEYAYDLLAENERIIASTFDAAVWASEERRLQKINVVSSSMVLRSATHFPTEEGEQFRLPAAAFHLRISKARLRIFRQGRLGAVPPALHRHPAVQLRRDRREARAVRQGSALRKRQAGDEPRRAGPRPEGAQGAGSAAHPRRAGTRSATTPTAGTSRAGSASAPRTNAPRTRISTSPRPSRPPCSSWRN